MASEIEMREAEDIIDRLNEQIATLKAENERLTKALSEQEKEMDEWVETKDTEISVSFDAGYYRAMSEHATPWKSRAEAAERALAERAGGVKVKALEAAKVVRMAADGMIRKNIQWSLDPAYIIALCDEIDRLSAITTEPAAPQEPDFASTIAALIKDECEGGAAAGWRSCSGCHETNEGYETGRYPYSPMFGCHVGRGCSECGGLGVVWEYWSESDLEAMARDAEPAAPEGRQEAVAWMDDGTLRAASERTAHRVITDEQKRDMPAAIRSSFNTPLYTRPAERAATEDERETKLATEAAPDNAPVSEVLRYVLMCAALWVPEARIIGNARAGDIVRALTATLAQKEEMP